MPMYETPITVECWNCGKGNTTGTGWVTCECGCGMSETGYTNLTGPTFDPDFAANTSCP
jgi:hypothetical protein